MNISTLLVSSLVIFLLVIACAPSEEEQRRLISEEIARMMIEDPDSFRGLQGIQGDMGPTGSTGETGPQGPIGVTGATGAQGDAGPVGATGATGAKGDAGSSFTGQTIETLKVNHLELVDSSTENVIGIWGLANYGDAVGPKMEFLDSKGENILNLGVIDNGGGIVIKAQGDSGVNASLLVLDSGPILNLTSPTGADGLYFGGWTNASGVVFDNYFQIAGTLEAFNHSDAANLNIYSTTEGDAGVFISSTALASTLHVKNAKGESASSFALEDLVTIATIECPVYGTCDASTNIINIID